MSNATTDHPEASTQIAYARRTTIAWATVAAFLAKLILGLCTYGTNDVYTYQRFGAWSSYFGAELYSIAPDLNHPPSMLHFLRFLIWTSQEVHLPFAFCLRFCGMLADIGTILLLCRIFAARLTDRAVYIAVLLIALAPTSIMISGFHGNTDPIMIFLVLLACWLVAGRERIWAAGIVFGLAFCVKITPVVVGPVLLLALPDFRKRLMFLSAALAVVLVAWSPYLFQQPVAVFHQVFGYKSSYGLWGLSWIFRELANAWPASAWVNRAFSRLGSSAVMLAILGLSVWMYRMKRKPSVYAQIGMVFLFFFTFTSGFAVQYLAWLTPWLVELGVVPVACFMLTTSVFLLVVYNYWNLGMPWYMAIAYPWSPHQYFQVICWLSVVVLTVIAWYRIRRADGSVNNAAVRSLRELGYLLLRISTPVRFGMAMVGIGIFLIYPAYRHMKRDTFTVRPTYAADDVLYEQADEYHNLATELDQRGRTREADAVQNEATDMLTRGKAISEELIRLHPIRGSVRTPEEYVDASLEDYNRGNFTQCVFDATESLQLRPGMPAAWNNISLCNSELGNWDAAVSAAIEALRIEPESDVVKANLDWALAEQKRASGASR